MAIHHPARKNPAFVPERNWTRAQLEKIQENPLIDSRTGTLRGEPVGTCALCHSRICSADDHRHVLWYRNGSFQLAMVNFAWEQTPSYVAKLTDFRNHQRSLRDLNALLLAFPSDNAEIPRPFQDSQGQFRLETTQQVLSEVLAQALIALYDRKRFLAKEEIALRVWCQRLDLPKNEKPQAAVDRACADAEEVLSLLDKEGCVLLHPTLPCPEPLARSAWQELQQRQGMPSTAHFTLFWRTRPPTDRYETRAFTSLVLAHEPALRYLLGRRAYIQQLLSLERRRTSLSGQVQALLPPRQKHHPTPDLLRQIAQQEQQQMQSLRANWEASIRVVQELPAIQIHEPG